MVSLDIEFICNFVGDMVIPQELHMERHAVASGILYNFPLNDTSNKLLLKKRIGMRRKIVSNVLTEPEGIYIHSDI